MLTFCGVSFLQAGVNGPLHAFGATVEAARASASASAAAQAIAAGTPVHREASSESPLAPSTIQAAGSVPSPVVAAPVADPEADDGGASDAQPASAVGSDGSPPGQARTGPGQNGAARGRDDGAPGQNNTAPGQSNRAPGQTGAAPGLATIGQSMRDVVSQGLPNANGLPNAGAAAEAAARQLTQEVNRWLRLADPPGLGVKASHQNDANQQNNGKKDQAPSGARRGQP
ncbi:MAG TPA: hypothetical protein VJQ61_07255 [Sinomonas sp.]|nr:hypothetical protein [Sinomonas sp.]